MALLSLHRNLKMLRQGWAKPELPFDFSLLHFVFEMWVKIRNGNCAPPLWIAALINLLAGVQGVPKWRASVWTGQARWAVSGHEIKNTEPFYSKYHKISVSGSYCSLDCREESSWKHRLETQEELTNHWVTANWSPFLVIMSPKFSDKISLSNWWIQISGRKVRQEGARAGSHRTSLLQCVDLIVNLYF